jgi:hypothetical protein
MKFSSKLGVGIAAVGAATAMVAGAAFAAGPVLTITSPTSTSALTYSSFPQTVDVEGTVAYTGGTGGGANLCAVKQLSVTVTGDGGYEDPIGYLDDVQSPTQGECPETSTTWSYIWSIPAAGSYTITATAKVRSESGTAVEEVVVYEETVNADYPAAPAVAAKILDEEGVPARYGNGRSGGNWISDVAHHMGPQTDFDGVSKSNVAEYEAAVRAFLVAAGAL